jgi:hypothetical protein
MSNFKIISEIKMHSMAIFRYQYLALAVCKIAKF